ncbi:MAG: class I SAM-dependent methyltransferase [Bacteroidetes bacterium]|nr:MAG: class I SAM-dependent methyltransferase [Bacteroidota bacterium]
MKHILRRIIFQINKIMLSGNKYYCIICDRNYRKFFSVGKRSNVRCPGCGSFERHRLLFYFLKEKTTIFKSEYSVMEVAPLLTIHRLFNKLGNIKYTSIDLESDYVTSKVDLTKLPFENDTYDCIFCYHVLEHIEDDIQALSEMFRVLKKGGFAIVQSPLDKSLEKTLQYDNTKTPESRLKAYGQKDHVRIYGRDFISRIESVGFGVTEDKFINSFSDEDINKFALDKEEYINFCYKPL